MVLLHDDRVILILTHLSIPQLYCCDVSALNTDGSIVGSIGVSGAAADEDEYLAWKGVQAMESCGLQTVPENHCCTTLK